MLINFTFGFGALTVWSPNELPLKTDLPAHGQIIRADRPASSFVMLTNRKATYVALRRNRTEVVTGQ